jgi:hypothetical protein
MHEWMCFPNLLTHGCLAAPEGCIGLIYFLHHSMWAFPYNSKRTSETLGDYMDTWKMTHFNELFFCEFALPNGPFQGNDWELGGEKVVKRIIFKY